MIDVSDKRKCSGCKACANSCSKGAITFAYDEEGCWYPKINPDQCVGCGKCEQACPYNDADHGVPPENRAFQTRFFAAQLQNRALLDAVSSGGAFQAIASAVIDSGGVVYGATQESVDHVFHIRAANADELKRTRRSKYLQSDLKDCFTQAKRDLQEGRTVLFSGTGCQIAGLNCFLGKRNQNLYTCEVVCHGVPSRRIWEQYRKEKEHSEGKKIVDLVFRDKSKGWSQNQYRITYDDGSREYEKSTVQLFHAGYLQGLFYRPSCGSCPFAGMPRTADITLADYWLYQGAMNYDDAGVSLVAVNNSHGMELMDLAADYLVLEQTSRAHALASCRHLDEHPTENPNRDRFMQKAFNDGYYAAAQEFIKFQHTGLLQRVKNRIKAIIRSQT